MKSKTIVAATGMLLFATLAPLVPTASAQEEDCPPILEFTGPPPPLEYVGVCGGVGPGRACWGITVVVNSDNGEQSGPSTINIVCAWAEAAAAESVPENCLDHHLGDLFGPDKPCYAFTESGGGSARLGAGKASTAGHFSRTCTWDGLNDFMCTNPSRTDYMRNARGVDNCFSVVTTAVAAIGRAEATATADCD